MCGIFGYAGKSPAAPQIVLEGLKELEYRGYDSHGIAAFENGSIRVRKAVGKISEVPKNYLKNVSGELAIGHTRWATHGVPSKRNAHPQLNAKGSIAVVHNGIVENYEELKDLIIKRLNGSAEGFTFTSETDTETIAHLIDHHRREGLTLPLAVSAAARELHGRFAFVVAEKGEELIVGVREGSPLVVGESDEGVYFSSDVNALKKLPVTIKKVIYLNDGEMAVAKRGGVEAELFSYHTDSPVPKHWETLIRDHTSDEKGEWPHFMVKEIMEQGEVLSRAIQQDEKTFSAAVDMLFHAENIIFTGCGTAGKVCQTGQYFFSNIAKRKANFVYSSEFDVELPFMSGMGTVLLAISQSGETADLLHAVKEAKLRGVKVISILNAEKSSLERVSDVSLFIRAGREKAVASTKAATAQMAILFLLAHACKGEGALGFQLMEKTAAFSRAILKKEYLKTVEGVAKKIASKNDLYLIGKGHLYPVALEAALKIQEVSYIPAHGFAGGELKHGPIALLCKDTPCIVLFGNDRFKQDIISNAHELSARGGYIIGVGPENHKIFKEWIPVQDVGSTAPIMTLLPLQILAYQLAVLRGNNPDMPRHLAKSVTVK